MKDLILKYLRALYESTDKMLVPEHAIPDEYKLLYFAIQEGLSPDEMELRGMSLPDVKLYHDVDFYASEVKNVHRQVKMIELAKKILEEGELDLKLLEDIEDLGKKDNTIKSQVRNTMNQVRAKQSGKEIPFLESGFTEMDFTASLDMRQIILIAAEKKLGKTKFIINLMVRLYDKYKIPVKFIALEPSPGEVIRTILSIKSNIPEKSILSRGSLLSKEQLSQLDVISADYIGNMDLHILDNARSLYEIKAVLRKFNGIVIIDNLGLIHTGAKNDNEAGDLISRFAVQLRDSTGSLIFVLHHLTKAAADQENIDVGYHPRLEYVRGTGRLLDYANQVWMIHRPAFYRDFMQQISKTLTTEEMKVIRKLFLIDVALNRHGDTQLVRTYADLSTSRFTDPWKNK